MSAATSLLGCAAKINRASAHADDLKRLLFGFIYARPYKPVLHDNLEAGEIFATLGEDVADPPSDEWGPIIGDIAHNLSSALDHLVCQLSVANGGSPDCANTEFPIFASEQLYRERGLPKLKTVSLGDECLLRDLQPYQRGNRARLHPLWLLRQINVIDKHRRLHVVGTVMDEQEITASHYVGYEIVNIRARDGRKAGDEILRFEVRATGDPVTDTDLNFSLRANIQFADGSGDLSGIQVAGLLDAIFDYVRDDVFPKFEQSVGRLPPSVQFSRGVPAGIVAPPDFEQSGASPPSRG